MTALLTLAGFLAAFMLLHVAISRPAVREPLVARLGRGGYGALHGILSTAGLAAVFWAYFTAPYMELWPQHNALRWIPPLTMPFACILFVAGITTPCAGLRGDRLPDGENQAPGILSVTRHPIPWALILWAGAHMLANGDLASLLFFGTSLAFSATAPALVDARRKRLCGEEAWIRFATTTATLPFAAPGPVDWKGIGIARVASGLALFLLVLLLHEVVIGVQPYP